MDPVHAAVTSTLGQVGPGLYGVACSGGADSLALAHAAIAVAGPTNVVVLAIDHGLQAGSAEVAAGVVEWARERGAAGVVRDVDVAPRASLEAAARDARYAALSALADEFGLAAVLLGHTARDQAETVLMRIVRGTGPAGLAGIPVRRGLFVRPLLGVTRPAIEAYCAAHELRPWDDPMNDDPSLLRTRIRHSILPALRGENPQLDAALTRLASATGEWLEVIDALARPFAILPIDCVRLAAQPAAVRKRAFAIALEQRGVDYDASHLDAIDELACARTAGTRAVDVPGARVLRTYDALDLVIVDVATTSSTRPSASAASPPMRIPPDGYTLRVWQPGDRMRPARLKGRSKKLSDLFIDAKVPRALRATAHVLVRCDTGEIAWAEHIGLAHGTPPNLVPKPA